MLSLLHGARVQTHGHPYTARLTNRAVASTPTLKAKVSFYDFILSDKGLIEVA